MHVHSGSKKKLGEALEELNIPPWMEHLNINLYRKRSLKSIYILHRQNGS